MACEQKLTGARFVRFYPSDWRSGCIGVSLEQEGLYIRMCAYIYETARRIPANDSIAAKFLGVHTNAYRKVRDQLAKLGKITRCDDGWTVDRAERELAAAVGHGTAGDQKRDAIRPLDQDPEWITGTDTVRVNPRDTPLDTPIDTPGDTPLVFSKNTNEINGPLIEPKANSQKPRLPPNPRKRGGGQFWQDALNPTMHADHPGVRYTDGKLHLVGDARAEWIDRFDGSAERLDLALIEIAGQVQTHSGRSIAEQVTSRLARIVAAKRDQDSRYAQARAANAASGRGLSPMQQRSAELRAVLAKNGVQHV